MARTNLVGKNILGYTVSEEIGWGAFGTVYKAVKTNAAGQYVRALKHIRIPTEKQYSSVLNSMGGDASKADNYFSQMLQNIVSEIRILNDLSEKGVQHIVRYYENDILAEDAPKRYDIFILMEYLTPLEDYMQRENLLVRDVARLGLDVLYGLRACHDNGVIHRDIKDDNIFVSEQGEYKIGDFGVSKVLKDSSRAESLKGTPNFLAPEVYLGKEGYTKSVDLYSLGIVLYRLLNYSRNPFLPRFPEQYFAQDEENAFEKRMSGKIPDLPSFGGEEIGRVIVKAISGSDERFQTAEEFIEALEDAVNRTPAEQLNESIQLHTTAFVHSQTESRQTQFNPTIGEMQPTTAQEEHSTEQRNKSIHKYLFESFGEVPPSSAPDIEPVGKTEQKIGNGCETDTASSRTGGRVVGAVPQNTTDPDEIAAVDKKAMGKLVYVMPVVIFLIGLIAFFFVVPAIYGRIVSFADWMFADPQNIIAVLRDSNAVLPKAYSIIAIRIFWWLWLASWITSLFFLGRQLHTKPEPNAENAILIKKEPYLMIQDAHDALKQWKRKKKSKQLDSLLYEVKRLEEKLSAESDFGYGKAAVIQCENNIARQLQFLTDTAPIVENGDLEENLKAMHTAIMNINSLLRRRTELKRR